MLNWKIQKSQAWENWSISKTWLWGYTKSISLLLTTLQNLRIKTKREKTQKACLISFNGLKQEQETKQEQMRTHQEVTKLPLIFWYWWLTTLMTRPSSTLWFQNYPRFHIKRTCQQLGARDQIFSLVITRNSWASKTWEWRATWTVFCNSSSWFLPSDTICFRLNNLAQILFRNTQLIKMTRCFKDCKRCLLT